MLTGASEVIYWPCDYWVKSAIKILQALFPVTAVVTARWGRKKSFQYWILNYSSWENLFVKHHTFFFWILVPWQKCVVIKKQANCFCSWTHWSWKQGLDHVFRLTLHYFHGFFNFVSPSKWLFGLKIIMVNPAFRKTIV